MTNGIIINGESYKIVRKGTLPLPPDTPCAKCALRSRCFKSGHAPCGVFAKGNYEVYFEREEKK